MFFEQTLINESNSVYAKLYAPAQKAFTAPTTGITVNTPAAEYVIRDCAKIAVLYLPHFIFGSIADPFEHYKGKFTIEQIQGFVQRAQHDYSAHQLMTVILNHGRNITGAIKQVTSPTDPYGDYDAVEPTQQLHDDVYKLCKLFGLIT